MNSCILGGTVSKSQKSLSLSINVFGVKEIPSKIKFLGFELFLTSHSKASNGVVSISYSTNIKEERFTTGKIYKVIPRQIYEIYQKTCQISRIYPMAEPESTQVVFKLTEDDPYGEDGFKLQEILEDLGYKVELSPIFNYNIVEFVVRKGASKEQIIRSLLAMPIVINYIDDETFEVNPTHAFSYVGGCISSASGVESIDTINFFTTGVLGKPIKVIEDLPDCDD
jgi:hypothetical protein